MKDLNFKTMNKKKGFIHITLLIAIIAGVLIVGVGGYFGVKQYRSYQAQKIEKGKQTQELAKLQQDKENQTEEEKRNQNLEIAKLKEEMEALKNQKPQTIIKEEQAPVEKTKDITITAQEIEPYLTGVVHLFCGERQGSGSLWNFSDLGYSIMTNNHVANNDRGAECIIGDTEKGAYKTLNIIYSFNNYTDFAILKINPVPIADGSWPISDLNYKISYLRKCSIKMPLGSPVVVVGYPAYTENTVNIQGEQYSKSQRALSNGIISAYEDSIQEPYGNLPYVNYFISAKIDSGNSGGIAFSKDSNGLCVLGIPTWLSIGNYETQGIIQNIYNVFYSE